MLKRFTISNILTIVNAFAGLIAYISSNMHNSMSFTYINNSALINFLTPTKIFISALLMIILGLSLKVLNFDFQILNFCIFIYCLTSLAYISGSYFPATTETASAFFTISIGYFSTSVFKKKSYLWPILPLSLIIIFKIIFNISIIWLIVDIGLMIYSLLTIKELFHYKKNLNTTSLLWLYVLKHYLI